MCVFCRLLKNVEEIEKKFGSLEKYAISTFIGDEHRLKIEEDYSTQSQCMLQVYQELSDLELADLYDFNLGRFNGEFD